MDRTPATADELYRIATHLGPIDAELVKSAADELVTRRHAERLRAIVVAQGVISGVATHANDIATKE